MARTVGFLYKDEKGLDDAMLATRIVLGINQTTGEQLIGSGRTVFAKVTALRADTDDKQATAVTVVYNATTRAFETNDELTFDSDNATADRTTTDIFSSEAMEVDQVLKIIPYGDSSEAEQWMAEQSGAGSTRVLIRLNADSVSANPGEYAGDIVTQRTATGNIVTANVTIWAPQINQGDLPLTGTATGRFYRADSVANVTTIGDAISALNDPPATIYEIAPPVFLGV